MNRQAILFFSIAVLVLSVSCQPPPVNQPTVTVLPVPVAPTDSPVPVAPTVSPAPTMTLQAPPRSPCVSALTPQPTIIPSTRAPSPAMQISPSTTPLVAGRSELREGTFYSAQLDQMMPFLAYLPPGYLDSTRRYPVLYMLSGFDGDHHEWVNWGMCDALEKLVRGGYIQPLIVVMPEGAKSWWFNHAPVPGSDGKRYGDYIWSDLVNHVDGNFRTLPRRTSRAIGGLSAGGQAAFAFALTHPEVFAIAGAHSPSIRHADGSLPFFGEQEYFNQYDPLWLFQNTPAWRELTLWMDVASEDTQWGNSVHDLHELLVSLGVPHDFQDSWHGIHDNYYWSAHIPDYLVWYASKLEGEERR